MVTKYKLFCSSQESNGFNSPPPCGAKIFPLDIVGPDVDAIWWRLQRARLTEDSVFVGLMSSSIMVTDVLVHCVAYIHHPEFQGHSTTMPGNWILMVEVTLMSGNLWNFPYSIRRKMAQAGIKLELWGKLLLMNWMLCGCVYYYSSAFRKEPRSCLIKVNLAVIFGCYWVFFLSRHD